MDNDLRNAVCALETAYYTLSEVYKSLPEFGWERRHAANTMDLIRNTLAEIKETDHALHSDAARHRA